MDRKWRKFLWLFTLVVICLSFDLYTKRLADIHLRSSEPIEILTNFVELRYTENEAIAFSMLHSIHPGTRKWIIYSLSSVALTFLMVLIWQVRKDSIWWLVALMLILSGALGNLSERIMRGYVIDFIYLHYYNRFSWPIFNIADILITCGGILLAILMLRKSPAPRET